MRKFLLVLAGLALGCTACGDSSAIEYTKPVDPCRLIAPATFGQLVAGTVEVGADQVKVPAIPLVQPVDGDAQVTTCQQVHARDVGGGRPDLQDFRVVTITAVRFPGPDSDTTTAEVQGLMSTELGAHSNMALASGLGDEAGYSSDWAIARSGNAVVVLSMADGGSEAALITSPFPDQVRNALADLVDGLAQFR